MALSHTIFWELFALVMITVAMGALLLPVMNGIFMGKEPEAIIIRMSVKETGGFDPDVITVKSGELIKLILTSMDVDHSFAIPELDVNSGPVRQGDMKVVEFIAPSPGIYKFHCITYCSPLHTFMNGKLVVI